MDNLMFKRVDFPPSQESNTARQQREQAVRAITERHKLQKLANTLQARMAVLDAKMEVAERRGQEDEARRLAEERQECELKLAATQNSLEQAEQAVRIATEEIKGVFRDEEERIREKTADALWFKTQWRNAQFPNYSSWQTPRVTPQQIACALVGFIPLSALFFLMTH